MSGVQFPQYPQNKCAQIWYNSLVDKYRISKNILYNFLGQAILLLLGFFTTPYIIHSLGNTAYGIFSVVLVTVGYFSVLDFGLGVSIVKYISEYHAVDDKAILGKIIATSLTTYLIVGTVGALLIFFLTPIFVGNVLKIPNELIITASTVFYISALGFLLNMILTVFNAIPTALQRMDITNSRNILFGLLNYLGMVLIIFLGGGLLHITVWNIFVSVTATIVFLKIITKLLKGVEIKLSFDKAIFLKLIRFGGFKFLNNVSGQVVFQLDKVIIGIFHPIALVTFYAVPILLVQKSFSLMLNITNAVFPAMSEAHSIKDHERSKQLYLRMTKFVVLIMFPIMAMIFVFSQTILSIWIGGEFVQKSSQTLKILSAAYFIASLSAPGVIAADAFGKPQIPALFAFLSAGINLVAALVLIPKFGIEGAAWALLINFIAQVPIFIILVNNRIVKVSTFEVFVKSYLRPVISAIIAIALVVFIPRLIPSLLIDFLAKLTIFSVVYFLVSFLIGTFDKKDKLAIAYFIDKII